MSETIHARLNDEEWAMVKSLKEKTRASNSKLIKQGLRLVYSKFKRPVPKNALEAAGNLVGMFKSPVRDYSNHKKHLQGYGE